MSDPDTESSASVSQPVTGSIVRSVAKLVLLVSVLWGLHQFMPDAETLSAAWHYWLTGGPVAALLLFVVGGMLFVAVGLPRQTVALVGGYVYGTITGGVLALLVTLAGSALTYVVARHVGRPRLQRRFPEQIAKVDSWTVDHVFAKTLALRLFPVGSNLATNIGAGLGHASPGPYFMASALGFIPQTAVFALSGTAVGDSSVTHMIVAVVMLIGSIIIGAHVFKLWRHL